MIDITDEELDALFPIYNTNGIMQTEKEILQEFEVEKGYDPHTTSDCELTNWLIQKLIESRREYKERHKDEIIHAFQSGSDNGVTMRSIEAGEQFYKETYETTT